MPIFYQKNLFRFMSLQELRYFLVDLPTRCRTHLRQVSFFYTWKHCLLAPDIMSRMSSLPHLKQWIENRWDLTLGLGSWLGSRRSAR